jgi:YYY domain-containing protein
VRAIFAIVGVGALALVAAELGSGRKLLLAQSEQRLYELHGTWSGMFDWGLAARAPVLVWVVALVLVGLIGFPYVWLAAASLPDRGYALSRPVGLLLVGWFVWLLAGAGVVDFSRRSIVLVIGICAAGAVAIAVCHRRELRAWLAEHRRLVLVEEAVFWSLFTAAVLVRFANPDLWHPTLGGEKPMDLAYLTAVTKSTHFPPYDPWFGGGQLNYYYFGFVLVAVLVKVTSVVPYVAYNLAVPTLFAFVGCSAASATLALTGRSADRRGRALGTAIIGAFLVAVAGNLGEIRVLAERARGAVPIDWWYWNPSRVIHHPTGEPGPINEFPSFTYLFADLHAHALALPYTIVALTLSVAVVRGGLRRAGGAALLLFVLLALVLGALWPLNTWDVPTYTGLAVAAVAAGWYFGPSRESWWGAGACLLRVGLLLVLAYVLFLPFHRHYAGVFAGVERWHGSRTRLNDYLTIHGLFLFLISTALVLDLARSRDRGFVPRTYRLGIRSWGRLARFGHLHRLLVSRTRVSRALVVLPLAVVLLVVVLAALGEGVTAVATGLGLLACLALSRRRGRSVDAGGELLWRATIVLFVVGLLITVGVEFLVAKNIDVGRTNTVFKFYFQVWVLWAIAAAVSLHRIYEGLPGIRRRRRVAWQAAFVVLLACAFLYPILATRAKIRDRFDTSVGPTLNGLAFADKAVFRDHDVRIPLRYDAEAIRWMQRTLRGSPLVAELNTYPTLYGWGDRYAMFTGNPTIVGWDYHQRQQRVSQSDQVRHRIEDVQSAYRTRSAETAYAILRRYGVAYVVVGLLERAYFPEGQAKWRSGDGTFWRRVYRNPGVDIYRLRQA